MSHTTSLRWVIDFPENFPLLFLVSTPILTVATVRFRDRKSSILLNCSLALFLAVLPVRITLERLPGHSRALGAN